MELATRNEAHVASNQCFIADARYRDVLARRSCYVITMCMLICFRHLQLGDCRLAAKLDTYRGP